MAVNKSANIEIEVETFVADEIHRELTSSELNNSINAEHDGVDVVPDPSICTQKGTSEVDSSRPNEFAMTKGIAEGMMDIALLTCKFKSAPIYNVI
ncbi:hypothetical protein HA402_012741 [Bradysia odoriphaga]|nr:hypothetical protein HA402_012741 [Bradysia odoriphaga]